LEVCDSVDEDGSLVRVNMDIKRGYENRGSLTIIPASGIKE